MLYIVLSLCFLFTICKQKIDLIVVLFSAFYMFIGFYISFTHEEQIKELTKVDKIEIITLDSVKQVSLKDSVELFMRQLNMKHIDIAMAQAQLESNFSSDLFKSNNNLFGMKQAFVRPTSALGTKNNHAYYESWQMSVIDYAFYQSYFMKGLNKDEYYHKLNESYAKNPHYIKHLKNIVKQNEKPNK